MLIAPHGAVALLLSLGLFISARPQPRNKQASPSPKHPIGTCQKVTGIPNFAEVTPKLYRGGQPDVTGVERLKKMGVDVVVDMRGGKNKSEEAAVQKAGMQFVSIPWHCPFPNDKPFARFLKLVHDNPGKKVFLHCRLGDDRTGMAVAAYRMADQGWTADEAMNEMRTFGFAGMHHAVCPGLAHYEHTFPHRLKTSPAFQDLKARSPTKK